MCDGLRYFLQLLGDSYKRGGPYLFVGLADGHERVLACLDLASPHADRAAGVAAERVEEGTADVEDNIVAHDLEHIGIELAVGILILDAGITMIKKMPKKKLPMSIMICSCIAMLCINIFALNFSTISLMLIAAVISLVIYIISGAPEQKGGANE